MMKKLLFLTMALIIFIASLAGCRKDPDRISPESEMSCKVYDTGEFKVKVPEGWHVIPITDPFAEGRPVNTDCIFLRKGGNSDWNAFEKPYIRIVGCLKEENNAQNVSDIKLHRNVEELTPFQLGELIWNGYTADEYHGKARIGKFADLWAEYGKYRYHAFVWFKSGGSSIKLSDLDVQMILSSLSSSDTDGAFAEKSVQR